MMKEPGFKERMNRWDEKCCSHRNKIQENGPAQRTNTIPHRFRENGENSHTRDFILNSGLAFWRADGSSSSGSEGTPSPFQQGIITQPEDQPVQMVGL